jgi:hypothetical protein
LLLDEGLPSNNLIKSLIAIRSAPTAIFETLLGLASSLHDSIKLEQRLVEMVKRGI